MSNQLAVINHEELATKREITIDLFNRWISYIDASKKTIDTYTRAIKQFFLYLQKFGIKQPQRDDILAYKAYLGKDHKATTVQSYLNVVKLFFQWTEREGLYPNIAQRVKSAKVDAGYKKDYLTTNQVNKLLKSIDRSNLKGKRDYAILSLMVTTGLRTISIINADIKDIRTVGDNTVLYYKGKGHDEKTVYVKIANPVEDAIRDYLAARGEIQESDPLFTSVANRNKGKRMTTRSISRLVKDRLKAINLNSERLTAHSLRHTAATLNLLNGGSLEETQQLLNHSSINMVLIYAHNLEREKNDSEIRIANAIFN